MIVARMENLISWKTKFGGLVVIFFVLGIAFWGMYFLKQPLDFSGNDFDQSGSSENNRQYVQAIAKKNFGSLGTFAKWSKIEINLTGPASSGISEDPNPFKVGVDVTFSGPGGENFVVPAFYDGDGVGGLNGNIWKVRFAPDVIGTWNFSSTSSESLLDNINGTFQVIAPTGCQAYTPGGLPDFSCVGILNYVGSHYLKFADGGYWIKGGEDDPEDFLAPGNTVGFGSKQAAIDFLASKGVNSLYMMLDNVGGDGRNVWPWVGATEAEAKLNHEHFDVAKLLDWEDIFSYLQERGLVLHLVLEDDSGWTGFNRQMYYREMIARFAHHNGIIWNISEEYNENYTPDQVNSFAEMIRQLDPYDHPITVHHAGGLSAWDPFVGDDNLDLTSFQTGRNPQNQAAVSWFNKVEVGGKVIPLSFDETGKIDAASYNLSRHIVWSVYLGGANFELHTWPLSIYPDFTAHFEDMTRARAFLEDLPFWQMKPMNALIISGQGYSFGKAGEVLVAYLPTGGQIKLDLIYFLGSINVEWFNPRTGQTRIEGTIEGGTERTFDAPDNEDWVLRLNALSPTPQGPSLYLPIIQNSFSSSYRLLSWVMK